MPVLFATIPSDDTWLLNYLGIYLPTTIHTSSFQIAVHLFPSTRLYTHTLLYLLPTTHLIPRLSRIVRAYAEYYVPPYPDLHRPRLSRQLHVYVRHTDTSSLPLCKGPKGHPGSRKANRTSAVTVPEHPCWMLEGTTLERCYGCCKYVRFYVSCVCVYRNFISTLHLSIYLSIYPFYIPHPPSSTCIHHIPSPISPYLTTSAIHTPNPRPVICPSHPPGKTSHLPFPLYPLPSPPTTFSVAVPVLIQTLRSGPHLNIHTYKRLRALPVIKLHLQSLSLCRVLVCVPMRGQVSRITCWFRERGG